MRNISHRVVLLFMRHDVSSCFNATQVWSLKQFSSVFTTFKVQCQSKKPFEGSTSKPKGGAELNMKEMFHPGRGVIYLPSTEKIFQKVFSRRKCQQEKKWWSFLVSVCSIISVKIWLLWNAAETQQQAHSQVLRNSFLCWRKQTISFV